MPEDFVTGCHMLAQTHQRIREEREKSSTIHTQLDGEFIKLSQLRVAHMGAPAEFAVFTRACCFGAAATGNSL